MERLQSIKLTPELKRVLLLLGGLILLLAVVGASLWYFTRDHEVKPGTIVTKSQLSDSEKQAVSSTATDFVNRMGTWGLRQDKLTAVNLHEAEELMRNNSQLSDNFWSSRLGVYTANQQDLIVLNSPLWYPFTVTGAWNDEDEQEKLMSFTPTAITANVDPDKDTMTIQGKSAPVAQATVFYTAHERVMIKTRDDELWDGSYQVMSKDFPSQLRLTLVRIDGVWKAYSLDSQTNPFTLAVWRDPTDYNDTQFNFHKESIIKAAAQ